MTTYLRLHRDPPATPEEQDAPITYKFPASMAAARRTLVAGTVNVHPVPEAPQTSARKRGVICRIDASGPGRDCMVRDGARSTDSLIQSVEATLANMQARLNTLRKDVDEECDSYKFPEPPEDRGPRAA